MGRPLRVVLLSLLLVACLSSAEASGKAASSMRFASGSGSPHMRWVPWLALVLSVVALTAGQLHAVRLNAMPVIASGRQLQKHGHESLPHEGQADELDALERRLEEKLDQTSTALFQQLADLGDLLRQGGGSKPGGGQADSAGGSDSAQQGGGEVESTASLRHRKQAQQLLDAMINQDGTKPHQREALKHIFEDSPGILHQLAGMRWRAKLGQQGRKKPTPPPTTADAFLAAADKWFAEQGESKKPFLFVRGIWGWGNRLRAYDGMYTLAQASGHTLVIVDNPLNTPKQFWGRWRYLVSAPDTLVVDLQAMPELDKKFKLRRIHANTNCEFNWKQADLEPLKGQHLYAEGICGANTEGEADEHTYIKDLQPTAPVQSLMQPTLDALEAHDGPTVGVHIRQGAVNDYYEAYFFGDWDNSAKLPPLYCCFANASMNLSPCSPNSVPVERFIEKMKAEPDNTLFFVASDRPGCLLHLQMLYPKRVLTLPAFVEFVPDPVVGVANWFVLSKTQKLVTTGISSYSATASWIAGVPVEGIWNH